VRGSGFGSVVFGKVGYGLACLAAAIIFVVSWYAHSVVAGVDGIAAGASLGSNVPPASAQNILLMGLESRTDFQGHFLSSAQLTQTHSGKESTVQAGSAGAGSQDTDTLILIHVFAGGQKASSTSHMMSTLGRARKPKGRSTRPTSTPTTSTFPRTMGR
jgi:hypothetical protein